MLAPRVHSTACCGTLSPGPLPPKLQPCSLAGTGWTSRSVRPSPGTRRNRWGPRSSWSSPMPPRGAWPAWGLQAGGLATDASAGRCGAGGGGAGRNC